MALIGMCCYDTETNLRTKYTRRTLDSLARTVNWSKHRLIICDNASCKATLDLYDEYKDKVLPFEVIYNDSNKGTSRGLNKIMIKRAENQHVLKIDNDVIIDDINWLDQLENAIERDPLNFGVAALKRRDLGETPWNEHPFYRSELVMLPKKPHEDWVIIEKVHSCIGTCTLFNWRLINKIGYSRQVQAYSFEDVNYCIRAKAAGFYCAFLPHISIWHIDEAEDTGYTKFKQDQAAKSWEDYQLTTNQYLDGTLSYYVEYND